MNDNDALLKSLTSDQSGSDVISLLTTALSDELLAAHQYWCCYLASRGKGKSDCDPEFSTHQKEELGHAEKIANRINQLGGSVTCVSDPQFWISYSNPFTPINTTSVKEMLEITIEAERTAILFYRSAIEAVKDVDHVTLKLFREILADEEEHFYDLVQLQNDSFSE